MTIRIFVLATLVGSGGSSITVFGQTPAEPPASAIAAVQIERVKENLYVITGSGPGDTFSGGNTAVFIKHATRSTTNWRHGGPANTQIEDAAGRVS